jgi:hypothetical protein
MKKTEKKTEQKPSPEQISSEEALRRMKSFSQRREKFVAAIKKSQD